MRRIVSYVGFGIVGLVAGLVVLLATMPGAGTAAPSTSLTPAGTPEFVGDDACLACHQDLQKPYAETVHGKIFNSSARLEMMRHGCEGCHGPGSEHVAAGGGKGVGSLITFRAADRKSIEQENGACLSCHRGGEQLHWDGSTHQMHDVACSSCHEIMHNESRRFLLAKPSQTDTCGQCHLIQKAQISRFGHMPLRDGTIPDRDGQMNCTSCHNPHGTVTAGLLKQNSVNENCYTCHADKRGPFLWEHPPVLENCLNCHDQHGSPREFMLKLSQPRLCQSCHDANHHPSDPRLPNNQFVIGSGCVQCHVNIHGSNHPGGNFFTR